MKRVANTTPPQTEDVALPPFIGRNIRKIRRSKGLTQADLGAKLRRRKGRQAIANIEAGGNTDLVTLADIAAVLEVDLSTLVTEVPVDAEAARLSEKISASTRTADFFRALADMVEQIDRRGRSE